MKFYFGLFVIIAVANLAVAIPSSNAGYVVGIRTPEFSTVSQSEIFLMKITQRIATALILPEQKPKADAILHSAKENFQKCEDEYLMSSLYALYTTCLRIYTRLAMSQVHSLELENRPEFMLPIVPTNTMHVASESQSGMGQTTNDYMGQSFSTNSKVDYDSNRGSYKNVRPSVADDQNTNIKDNNYPF